MAPCLLHCTNWLRRCQGALLPEITLSRANCPNSVTRIENSKQQTTWCLGKPRMEPTKGTAESRWDMDLAEKSPVLVLGNLHFLF